LKAGPDTGGHVLVTGGTSGIGAACIEALRARGLQVVATARDPRDFGALVQAGATPLAMDVADRASVEAGCAALLAMLGTGRLAGVVNNAGVAAIGPWEHLPIAELRRLLDTNVIGAVSVTQLLLPRLRQDRGRVVLLSSVAGRVAMPFLGAYACSKFALEAFGDSLRRELARTGVRVVVVQPSAVRTPIWSRLDPGPPPAEAYRAGYLGFRDHVLRVERDGLAPAQVAAAVARALLAPRPPARILVTRRNPLVYRLYASLPDVVIDFVLGRRDRKSSTDEST
jgi:NAD(P)-dependent dehydrogenase (short-subunit alcohol dehydrogenase family)